MAVKIRLSRRGRKKLAIFDVVVADARAPRDGRFIEKIGTYNPNTNPATINLDDEKAFSWVMKGAQPTDTVKAMLSYRGVMLKKHLQIGVIKGAMDQEQADAKFNDWKDKKESKIAGTVENLSKKRAEEERARIEAEAKVKEARAETLRKRQEEANAAANAETADAPQKSETTEAETTETENTKAENTEAKTTEAETTEAETTETKAQQENS
ncbi:30S ribosomal protein S16 [soil metagenome]